MLAVGGRKSCSRALQQAIAPKPEAAPMVWPSIDLMELIGGMRSPNTSRAAATSVASLVGVPVPWAQM